ncbi:hemicentin-1-like [Littorina saxatilis]|uniref:hemicentin-1-like n=1 Tax=Littorina saxatilis TaxID=31220 RepID=UPI0038B610C6
MSTPAPSLHSPHGVCVCASLFGLFLWAILSTVSAARPLRYTLPTFLNTSVNITSYRGTDVDLPCAIRNLGPKVVVWKKINQVNPITIGQFLFDPDSSYEVVRPKTPESPEWNLRITDVQMRHAGVYECQISTKEDLIRNVTLTVVDAKPKNYPVPPRHDGRRRHPDETGMYSVYSCSRPCLKRIKLDGNEFVEKGMAIMLNCTATAIDYRPKGVDWFKDGSKIKSDAHVLITESSDNNVLYSTLEIFRSNMSDAGTYVCRSSKYHVASLKVIVLNSESETIKKQRDKPPYEGSTKHPPVGPPQGALGNSASKMSPASSSVLLLHALLCWPLLRALT